MNWPKWNGGKKEQILILLLVGVLLLVIALPTQETQKDTETAVSDGISGQQESGDPARDWTEYLEQKLQAALSHVSGVGRAEVILTVKSDGRALVEKDTARQEEKTNETDGQGERSFVQSSESTVYEKDASGKEIPFVSETVLPEICGVLVLAEGGGDGGIQAEITEAAMALFDLDAHKIKVMKLE